MPVRSWEMDNPWNPAIPAGGRLESDHPSKVLRQRRKMSVQNKFLRHLEQNYERQTWEFPGASSYTIYKRRICSCDVFVPAAKSEVKKRNWILQLVSSAWALL